MQLRGKHALAMALGVFIAALFAASRRPCGGYPQYVCNGFEPFWNLKVTSGSTTYHRAGFSPVTRPTTGLGASGSTFTLTSAIPSTAILTPVGSQGCAEDPSGGAVTYSYSATLTIGSETLKGCCK